MQRHGSAFAPSDQLNNSTNFDLRHEYTHNCAIYILQPIDNAFVSHQAWHHLVLCGHGRLLRVLLLPGIRHRAASLCCYTNSSDSINSMSFAAAFVQASASANRLEGSVIQSPKGKPVTKRACTPNVNTSPRHSPTSVDHVLHRRVHLEKCMGGLYEAYPWRSKCILFIGIFEVTNYKLVASWLMDSGNENFDIDQQFLRLNSFTLIATAVSNAYRRHQNASYVQPPRKCWATCCTRQQRHHCWERTASLVQYPH